MNIIDRPTLGNGIVVEELFRRTKVGMRNAHQIRSEALHSMLKTVPAAIKKYLAGVACIAGRHAPAAKSGPDPRHSI